MTIDARSVAFDQLNQHVQALDCDVHHHPLPADSALSEPV